MFNNPDNLSKQPTLPRRQQALRLAWWASVLAFLGFSQSSSAQLLNASFDISRELFAQLNPRFIQQWASNHPAPARILRIQQSHGGSTKQARAVIDGLNADVVTLNQATDLDAMAAKGLVSEQWRSQFPHGSAPFASTIVFMVRKGNPKGVRDWTDLARPGISVVIPNPKTSGNGRYSYLAAYAFARNKLSRDQDGARQFLTDLFRNVPVLDTGGRGATSTFAQRGVGDVLVTFEAEAFLTLRELDRVPLEIIRPSYSIEAELPVALVQPVARRKGNEEVANAYLKFLFSEPAQEIAARNYFRPRLESIRSQYKDQFGTLELFRVEETLGTWNDVQRTHFADGGMFDTIAKSLHQR